MWHKIMEQFNVEQFNNGINGQTLLSLPTNINRLF